MQALEGDIDTSHLGFLHAGHVVADRDYIPGSADYYATRVRIARYQVAGHEIGATYAAVRPAEEESEYWRTGHFLLPFFTMNAPGVLPLKNVANAWVPLDDEHTMVWGFGPGQQQTLDPQTVGVGGLKVGSQRTDPQGRFDPYPQRQPGQNRQRVRTFLKDTSDWLGRFRAIANQGNDYLIDRDLQASIEQDPLKPQTGTYTGIPGNGQDPMAQESMGPIYDRTQERLATSDNMIIFTRRKLIVAAKALRDGGTVPPGVDNPGLYRMRSGGALLPRNVDGLDLLRPIHMFQADDVEQLAPLQSARN
jgi:phthalate 4,5-dioxygenase oxygenase subunit